MESDPTRTCELQVGLHDVNVLGVGDWPSFLRFAITTRVAGPACPACGGGVWLHDRVGFELVDLPCFGRRSRLVRAKQRLRFPHAVCGVVTFVEVDYRIALARVSITDRAGPGATSRVDDRSRSVTEVANELRCGLHTVMNAVVHHGRALIKEPNRIGATTAVGLDEVLFCRLGPFRHRVLSTQIVDIDRGQLSMSCRAVTLHRCAPGSLIAPSSGATTWTGQHLICRTPIGLRSTRCCLPPSRSPARSTS